ncbi:MAG: hypothetical protein GX801_02510 [Fibrobacter sp.]|nr:hypothetical protein [Fibrobacter sp.]
MTKLSLKRAKILAELKNGAKLAYSYAKSALITELYQENIVFITGKHRKTVELINGQALDDYLANQMQIYDLEEYVAALETEASRGAMVKVAGNSKLAKGRAFTGFLVNCYEPILASLRQEDFMLNPKPGSFVFVADFETFTIPSDVTVIGMENAQNFIHIKEQKHLFSQFKPLFISRYPQNQNRDVISWLQKISNPYLHFGDFDLAGIGIYLHEYKKHLGSRAQFFIPPSMEKDIQNYGLRERYHVQTMNFNPETIAEPQLRNLVTIIHAQRKGLDQEFYIDNL